MRNFEFKRKYSQWVIALLAAALLTTVAGINISMLLLLFAAPWYWKAFEFEPLERTQVIQFFLLIAAFCSWDIVTNMLTGSDLVSALSAMSHDLRPFIFVVLLWPIFAAERLARFAFWALIAAFVAVAGANLVATLFGLVHPGQYLWRTMHHLHGQMSAGAIFLLAQLILVQSKATWRTLLPLIVLIASMVLANDRRAGYFLFIAGLPLWIYLNRDKFAIKQNRWVLMAAAVVILISAGNSSLVESRLALILQEIYQYLALSPEQRAGVTTSVGIRLQFYVSIWELIKQSNWLIGVGSINFGDAFSVINYGAGTTPEQAKTYFSNFQNPHNEYLFMLATKGMVGLLLYLSIFWQACRMAMQKQDQAQRIGLLMFICMFMLSITFNSMVIDMEEGHFMMLILLVFLAPKKLELTPPCH